MKIAYDTTQRKRTDVVRVVINVEEVDQTTNSRDVRYQPSTVTVAWSRSMTNGKMSARQEWHERYDVEGRRVLKSGALSQQSTRLYWVYNYDIEDREPRFPWLEQAVELARERFQKIIADWPDPTWL